MSRPTRRDVLEGAAALAAVGCGPGQAETTGPTTPIRIPPGAPIIYLFVDQLRFDALGCAGNPVVQTPHIDALAAEGVRFSACVTNAPSCRAARATMMTGLHVVDHGVWDNHVLPDTGLQSHVRRLRDEAGYHTLVVGKTHLHGGFDHLDAHVDVLRRWGFVDAVELPDPQQDQVRSAHSDWLTATTPPGETDKFQRWGDYIRQYTWASPPPDLDPWRLSTEDHLDSFCARVAADVIRDYAEDRPLYLQVNFPGPHKPFDPTSEFLDVLDPADPRLVLPIPGPPAPPVAPLNLQYQAHKLEDWDEDSARDLRVSYFAKVALVDRGIGEVVAALRDAGLYDAAWVILHSDHGELLADHGMTGKVLGYEGSVRVPLIVKPPGGIASPWVDEGQVDQMDLVATLLAMGGLDPDTFGDRVLIDRILEGAAGPSAHASKTVLFENLGHVGLRTDTMKFGWDLSLGRPVELFDLRADPDEQTNLVDDPDRGFDVDGLVAHLRGIRPLPVDHHDG